MAKRIAELEDEIKVKDRRIEELRQELDEARDLIRDMEEQIDDHVRTIERWIEGFGMVQNADGIWQWDEFVERWKATRRDYDKILRDWNRFVPDYNSVVVPRQRNVGRPIAASDVQQEEVCKLRKQGHSLRSIAEATSLGLRTVITILGKANGTDRTSVRHLARIDPDRAAALRFKTQVRTIDSIPKSVNALLKNATELRKRAKGLK
jgi:hypothetical protein